MLKQSISKGLLIRILKHRALWVAVSQVCGLLSFTVVAKFLLSSEEMRGLASYQGCQAVSAFFAMSIQYSSSRTRIFGVKFACFLLAIYGFAAFILVFIGNEPGRILALMVVFATASYGSLLLAALNRFSLLLCLQIFNSLIIPFAVINAVGVAAVFLLLVLSLIWFLKDSLIALSDMRLFEDGKNWASSLSLQAPLVLLPVFDGILIQIIGPEVYRNYALILKYCTGPINFAFAASQFRVLENKFYKHGFLELCCWVSFWAALLFIVFGVWVVMQVVALVIFTNYSSLIVRTNNFGKLSQWSLIVGPLALVGYFVFLHIVLKNFVGLSNYFLIGQLASIALSAIFAAKINSAPALRSE